MKKSFIIFRIILVAASFLLAIWVYPQLPQIMPIHWNIEGVADGFGDKSRYVWLLPVISLAMLIFMPLLAKIDPKKANYQEFALHWEAMQTTLILVMQFIFFLQIHFSLNPSQSDFMGNYMLVGIGFLFIIFGYLMSKIKQNYFIGIRTPWALENTDNWDKTQKLGGFIMALGGVIMVVCGIFSYLNTYLLLTIFIFMVFIPMLYSYLLFKGKH